ncbi:MAG: methyltransferase domain-containing protein [Syntrophobacteraceae bacterium]
MRGFVRDRINVLLHMAGYELVRWEKRKRLQDFLPLQETLAGAKAAGLSVGDYIDARHTETLGATQKTIDQMAALGVFSERVERVCEIGPGSGRYLEKTLQACKPVYYEIYETALEWSEYLSHVYKVKVQPCDGMSLGATSNQSIDLAHAHKLFIALPSFAVIRYFSEMTRVVRGGGKVVFDILTEECFDDPTLKRFFAANVKDWSWTPNIMPKQFVVEYFDARGFALIGSFFVPLWPGKTNCMVFSKHSSQGG